MADPITVIVDHETIQFTPEGKIVVLDAIASLCGSAHKQKVWQDLLLQHPELDDVCEYYRFSPHQKELVTDGRGWETIQAALFDYMVEAELN